MTVCWSLGDSDSNESITEIVGAEPIGVKTKR